MITDFVIILFLIANTLIGFIQGNMHSGFGWLISLLLYAFIVLIANKYIKKGKYT